MLKLWPFMYIAAEGTGDHHKEAKLRPHTNLGHHEAARRSSSSSIQCGPVFRNTAHSTIDSA
jgi:hypothetical protein